MVEKERRRQRAYSSTFSVALDENCPKRRSKWILCDYREYWVRNRCNFGSSTFEGHLQKGRNLYIKLAAGEEVEYDAAFQLYLQTKLNNPHYKPEIAAQCTIINFIATEKCLEDQLLAKVVEMERKDLEDKARELTATG